MKKYVVSASLLAGLSMLAAAPAFAQVSGTVGANYSRDDDTDSDAYGVNGGVTIPTGGSLAVLLEGSYSTNDDADIDTLAGTAHLISRNDSQAFGGFATFAQADGGVVDVDVYGVGGEYAKFFDQGTLALGLSYLTADDTDVDATALTGEYRIFASDNLRFDLGAGYGMIDTPLGDDDAIAFGAGVEYRFGGAPVSLGANVRRLDADSGDSTVFGATLRFDFGNGSLKERDRKGNTFGDLNGLNQTFLQ